MGQAVRRERHDRVGTMDNKKGLVGSRKPRGRDLAIVSTVDILDILDILDIIDILEILEILKVLEILDILGILGIVTIDGLAGKRYRTLQQLVIDRELASRP